MKHWCLLQPEKLCVLCQFELLSLCWPCSLCIQLHILVHYITLFFGFPLPTGIVLLSRLRTGLSHLSASGFTSKTSLMYSCSNPSIQSYKMLHIIISAPPPPAAPPGITERGYLSPWWPPQNLLLSYLQSTVWAKSSFCGWHFPENPSSVRAYLFLSSCLCDFGQFWAHTLLIPHLLHGKCLLSLLSLEFNARKELWANSEQEAQFPGSTAQFCKCTKKKQTDAQFSPSAYSLRLSGWFLQCLNHRSIRLFLRIEIIH